jgi:hypothetical protein
MGKRGTLITTTVALGLLSGVASAQPEKQVEFGKPFTLRSGQRAKLGSLGVRVVAEHHGIERAPNGIELFPITSYTLEWQEGAEKSVNPSLLAAAKDQRKEQARIFDRYTFTLERGSKEDDLDEVTLTVFRRTCLLQYTFSNQLKHPNGEIIFTELEDLCCYYSDGKNRCDAQVTRASRAGSSKRYCVLYLKQQKSDASDCCCRFEKGEPLDKACETECKRVLLAAPRTQR